MNGRATVKAAMLVVLSTFAFLCCGSVQAKIKGTNFFTTPDATTGDVPTFSGKPKSPVAANALAPDGEMPRDNDIYSIPSLTGDQRKQIGKLFQDCRKTTQPMRDEENALEKRQRQLKQEADKAKSSKPGSPPVDKTTAASAAPATAPVASNKQTKPSLDAKDTYETIASGLSSAEIDARVPVLKQQMKDEFNLLSKSLSAILTPNQLSELDEMRHGTLTITSDSRTDAQPPPPKPAPAKPQQAKQNPPTSRPQLHNSSYNKHDVWQFLWGLR